MNTATIGIGIVGYGYWGPNLARNFANTDGACLAAVCDIDATRHELVRQRHPTTSTYSDYRALLADTTVAAVALAVPVSKQYELAMEALRAGKHLWAEKPLAATSAQARHMIEEADRRNLKIMVDHTFVYTGAVRKIAELVSAGDIGTIRYYDSVRVNLGIFRPDMNVVWDLAVHDLSIMGTVLRQQPKAVSATGVRHFAGQHENIAYLTLYFDDSLIGHLHVNWLSPVKIRQTLIGGSKKMIVYDDLNPSEKVKVYGSAEDLDTDDIHRILGGYRTGDVWVPQIDLTEALGIATAHFVDCIRSGRAPATGGAEGLQIVQILEAASQSMSQKGAPVEIGG